MSQRNETDHPLLVSKEAGDLAGCSREDCRLWGSGMLRFVQSDTSGYSANIILTAAGCQTCPDVTVTQGDLGVKNRMEEGPTRSTRELGLSIATEVAEKELAKIVQGFAPDQPSVTS